MIHGHGDDIYQYREIKINFSSNVYQQLDLSELKTYLCQNINDIHSYPEPDAQSLIKKIAQQSNVLPDNICVTNGATEAIYLIAQAFRGSRTAILSPVFSEYADACRIHEHKIQPIFNLTEFTDNIDLLWLCNPNNPTGEGYNQEVLLSLVRQYPNTVFVMDHSYAHFTEHPLISIEEAVHHPNIVLLHSMTKNFAIPGLRLGYMSASSNLLEKIKYFRMPWSVNQFALLAGEYLCAQGEKLSIDLPELLRQTKVFQNQLSKIDALQVFPTQTHYFLVKLKNNLIAAELKDYLARVHHILIRDASNFVGLDQSYFRVACQRPEQNALLVEAIKAWLKTKGIL